MPFETSRTACGQNQKLDHPACQWIVFDAVGTLIDPSPPVAIAYHTAGLRHGSRLNADEVGKRFRLAFRNSESTGFRNDSTDNHLISNDQIEEARWRWIVGQVFDDVEDREACFRMLWDHFASPASWRCFDDVGSTLNELRAAGFRLAIASNFDRRLHTVCDALPELEPIERRVVSAHVGYRKPAPEFYASLATACACPVEQILMVGDSYEHDVQGPKAAGLQSLHLVRRSETEKPDQLCSLNDLIHYLGVSAP